MSKYAQELRQTAKAILTSGKGILGMDDSGSTYTKRFTTFGIPTTNKHHHAYRKLILTTPSLNKYVSAIVLHDETVRQSTQEKVPFTRVTINAGIIPGVKVDKGAQDLAGHSNEKVTEGLDGLRDRIAEYYEMGIRFAKWRAIITVGNRIPSLACIEANAHALARYAALCQEGGLVPLVEPEILIDGDHTIERCYEVTDQTLQAVFANLNLQKVEFDQMILKASKVIPGLSCSCRASVEQVAEMTMKCLLKNVPTTVAGIIFLSKGQNNEYSTEYLNAMNTHFGSKCPWPVSFSFARAIQQPSLKHWQGDDTKIIPAQELLYHQLETTVKELPLWASVDGSVTKQSVIQKFCDTIVL